MSLPPRRTTEYNLVHAEQREHGDGDHHHRHATSSPRLARSPSAARRRRPSPSIVRPPFQRHGGQRRHRNDQRDHALRHRPPAPAPSPMPRRRPSPRSPRKPPRPARVVSITGTNFTGATPRSASAGRRRLPLPSISATSISATVGSGATGTVSVTTPMARPPAAARFTCAPTITSFSPTSAGAGTVVTITGN